MAIVNGWIALPVLLLALLVFAWKTAGNEPSISNPK